MITKLLKIGRLILVVVVGGGGVLWLIKRENAGGGLGDVSCCHVFGVCVCVGCFVCVFGEHVGS